MGTIAAWTAVAAIGAKVGSSVIGAKVAAGGQKSAARTQAAAAQRAAEIEANATREALEYTKEQDRLQRQDWERRERRITPYRQGWQQATRTMASLMPGSPQFQRRGPGGPGPGGVATSGPWRPRGGEIGLHRRRDSPEAIAFLGPPMGTRPLGQRPVKRF